MAQKLTSLEEAATLLGISKDRLNQLREAGKVRGYRDGANWKFRSEDIERLQSDGIPPLDGPPSDIGMDFDEDELGLADDGPVVAADGTGADHGMSASESDLSLADDGDLSPGGPEMSGLDLELADELPSAADPPSDLNLDDVDEPTVAGLDDDDSDALAIGGDDGPPNISDSILLSEAELGDSGGRPPSTIIGKAELDADLDLSPLEPSGSDVKLAAASGILPGLDDDDLGLDLPSPSGDFSNLEELEVDLEAESSRILSPDDVAKVRKGAAAQKEAEISDLQLAPSDSTAGRTSDVGVGSDISIVGSGITGLSALELEDDDDQVLGEGSDVTLSGESSGINIISPSDSGLALDEVSLDLSGASAIGSSLDLGSSISEEAALGSMIVGEGLAEPQAGEDFQLTPLGEEGSEDEERDSSQVIALDEISEETAGGSVDVGMGEGGMMREEFAAGMAGLTPGMAPVGVVAAADTPFSVWNVLGLGSCLMLIGLCSMMVFDLLRNIWSWDGVTPLNSSLLEVLNPFL